MSYDVTDIGCSKCDYAWKYFINGLKPCPDAYTDKSILCGAYNHSKRETDGSTRVETAYKKQ